VCRARRGWHLPHIQSLRRKPQTCLEGPFGEVIRATGPLAKANPFRFSTKYQDDETDLLYYGYRYYSTPTGRWLAHDPLAEGRKVFLPQLETNQSTKGVIGKGGKMLRASLSKTRSAARLAAQQAAMNPYGFVDGNPVNTIDIDGLEIGRICPNCGLYYVGACPSCGYPDAKPKIPANVSICTRHVDMPGACGCGYHKYLQFTHYPAPPQIGPPSIEGWGFHGTAGVGPDGGAAQSNCSACRRTSAPLQNGWASEEGKTGLDATDEEIWDCIKSTPPSHGYVPLWYDCANWAKEAAGRCGLSCGK